MGLDRRSFISLVAGGVVGGLFTPVIWKGLDDVSIWSQNWPWIPRLNYGPELKLPAICKLGSDAYGIKVKTVGGNPVVAEGNPDHLLSQGGICPLGAASVEMLYSPSRVKNPKVKDGATFKDIGWDEAEALLVEKLKSAGSKVAMVSGDETGSVTDILAGLVAKAGSGNIFLMPGESGPATRALTLLGGDGQIGYDLEGASLVLLLGADALGSWANVARNSKIFAQGRSKNTRFIFVGPAQNGTAAVSDMWVPCVAGTEPVLALGLAAALIEAGQRAAWPGFDEFAGFVQKNYPVETVAEITGVPAETIKALAKDLSMAGQPLVLTAASSGFGLGTMEAAAGLSLNMLLGRVNTNGGIRILPWNPQVVDAAPDMKTRLDKDVIAYLTAIAAGSTPAPDVLLVHAANPAYALPNLGKAQAALDQVGFVVSFSPFMDETAAMADLILPDCYAFERLDDAYSPYGSGQPNYTVAAPIIKPVFDTKPAGDLLLSVAAAAGLDLGFESFEDVVKAKAEALGADYDELLEGTVWAGQDFEAQDLMFAALASIPVPATNNTLALSPVVRLKIGSPRIATPPSATNAIRYDEMLGQDMYVLVNGATANALSLKKDDLVKLAAPGGECKARVRIFEGVVNDTVVAPLGFGHTAWDDFSKGKGDNVCKLLTAEVDSSGISRIGMPRVTVSKL